MSMKILVVDDKQALRDSVATTLQRAGFLAVAASSGQHALAQLLKHKPSAVISDLRMPEMDGIALLGRLKASDPTLPVVIMTAYGAVEDAVEAMRQGAFDFIQKPFEGDQLITVLQRAIEHRRCHQQAALKKPSGSNSNVTHAVAPTLVGKSSAMKAVAKQIHQIANSSGTVLIQGASGTGKEVVARTIHAHSPRRDKLMLCLNCAALSSNLLESELFGHERGAFTGADQMRKGRFELADGGTLFLDEISEISPSLQAKLLRVLQEGQFERVGSSHTMKIDVRVIATTNRDLMRSVADGSFRQDLYYRLNVLPIELPPLNQRLDDIPLLAEHFLSRVAEREGKDPKGFDKAAMQRLQDYHWPGNVRELQNICERSSVMTRGPIIGDALIQPWLLPSTSLPDVARHPELTAPRSPLPMADASHGSPPLQTPGATSAQAFVDSAGSVTPLEQLEREQIVRTLGRFQGNRTRTAEALGIGVRTLGLKLKKWKEQNLVAQTI